MYRFGFFERLYGHHIGLMYFGLFVFRLQVQVCQGVNVLSCIVIRPTLPSELAIILDGTSSNPLEPHPDGRSSNLRLKDLPRARLEPATQWVTSGLPTTVLSPPRFVCSFGCLFVCLFFGHIELFLDVVYNIALKIPFV